MVIPSRVLQTFFRDCQASLPANGQGDGKSQSMGELILSVLNCIYWPCLAPPNPGLWWCINSCGWLFTRHLLAGVNITRQIPPITLITPPPGLCHWQQQSQKTHRLRLRSKPLPHLPALAIVRRQSDYLLSNCQPGNEVVTANFKWIKRNEWEEGAKDNGQRNGGIKCNASVSQTTKTIFHTQCL